MQLLTTRSRAADQRKAVHKSPLNDRQLSLHFNNHSPSEHTISLCLSLCMIVCLFAPVVPWFHVKIKFL